MFNYPFTNDKEVIMKHSLVRQFYISALLIITSLIFSVQAYAISASVSTVQAGETYSVNYSPYNFLEEKVGEDGTWTYVAGTNGTAEISGRPEGIYYYRGVVIDFTQDFRSSITAMRFQSMYIVGHRSKLMEYGIKKTISIKLEKGMLMVMESKIYL